MLSRMRELRDYETFSKLVGLLDDAAALAAYGVEADEDNGSFATTRLAELQALCARNPELHIVTEIDDEGAIFCLTNEAAVVNRINYYLANGSTEPAILLETGDED